CQPNVYRYRRSVLRKPNIDSGTGRRRMRLESVAKFHSPKSPMMSDSPRATASDSLSGTDVMAAMGMAQSQAGFGMALHSAVSTNSARTTNKRLSTI
ncbi:antitermination protein Q, partial [Vibrio viridaestus]|uniref:antitermination protein Q n=1 Tax=Vibrio viridaestus TaxID=2487322 RepID=UPI003F6DB681